MPWGFVGAGMILILVIPGLILRRSTKPADGLIALAILAAGIAVHFAAGKFLSMDIRFLIAKHRFESRVAEILKHGADPRDADVADTDGPRVAFYWIRGFGPDNWVGLVHDPTGDVRSNTSLFGGTITATRHLSGNWYLCWFT
jgi:hypothetical protein